MTLIQNTNNDNTTFDIHCYFGKDINSYSRREKLETQALVSNVFINAQLAEAKEEETFTADFVQLGSKFYDRMTIILGELPELLQSDVLQKVQAKVYKTSQKFEFTRHGFEFLDCRDTRLGQAIDVIAKGPTSWPDIPEINISHHANEVENALTSWAKDQGFQFSQAVWIDTVYRNTAGGLFGPVHFAHVDFPAEDSSATLRGHADWKDRVVKKLGDMTQEEYEKLNIAKIVNIWMPLDDELVAEPLAIMDIQSIKDPSQELRVYEDVRTMGGTKYLSVGIMPQEGQRWYVKDRMKRGEVAVFDTCRTPHSAVSFPDQGNKGRRSLECRVIFLSKPIETTPKKVQPSVDAGEALSSASSSSRLPLIP